MATSLPAASDFTGNAITEGQFKTAMTDLRAYLSTLLGSDGVEATARSELGILFSGYTSKSAGYTVVAGDCGKLIDCTAALTLAFTAAATLAEGFVFHVKNSGSGSVVLDPNAGELIDGAMTLTLSAGEACSVFCTGTAFVTGGKTGVAPSVDVQTFTSSGTWTKPARGSIAIIECWGGGGSGAKGSGFTSGGGGGGGGNYVRIIKALSSLSSTESVTIGAGGAGKTSAGAGNSGGNTTFGSHVTAHGGQGGAYSADLSTASAGGGGGVSSGMPTVTDGKLGGIGGNGGANGGGVYLFGVTQVANAPTAWFSGGNSYYGGGGGGAGGSRALGGSTDNTTGNGGHSCFGGGGGGGGSNVSGGLGGGGSAGVSLYGGSGSAGAGSSPTASSNASSPGGGSGGSMTGNTGNGGDGKCIVTVI